MARRIIFILLILFTRTTVILTIESESAFEETETVTYKKVEVSPLVIDRLKNILTTRECFTFVQFFVPITKFENRGWAWTKLREFGDGKYSFNCSPALDFWSQDLFPPLVEKEKDQQTAASSLINKALKYAGMSSYINELEKLHPNILSSDAEMEVESESPEPVSVAIEEHPDNKLTFSGENQILPLFNPQSLEFSYDHHPHTFLENPIPESQEEHYQNSDGQHVKDQNDIDLRYDAIEAKFDQKAKEEEESRLIKENADAEAQAIALEMAENYSNSELQNCHVPFRTRLIVLAVVSLYNYRW